MLLYTCEAEGFMKNNDLMCEWWCGGGVWGWVRDGGSGWSEGGAYMSTLYLVC